MERDDFVEANRQLWNEAADIHASHSGDSLQKRVQAPNFSTFDDVERSIFKEIGLPGKAVIQLACNNGRELISVKKAGAGRCMGVDVSEKFIAQARQLATLAGVEIEFLCQSVYDLPRHLDGQFDLVYITIGACGWLPDLDAFFEIIARLLKPNGQVFIYEMHPMLDMFDAKKGLVVDSSYFRDEPFVQGEGADYLDPSQTLHSVSYWFHHKLSEIIGGCLHHGLMLTHFDEYGHDLSMEYAAFEDFDKKPPLSFSLVARKAS